MKYTKYSCIIIGSGIAGLYASLKIAQNSKLPDGLLVVTKSKLDQSNSRYAQGGIVGVLTENKEDSISLHVSDTIKSGCGLGDFSVVKFISENSNRVIKDLISMGVEFDQKENGDFSYSLEGAHSIPRILHCKGDATGYNIEKVLCENVRNNEKIEVYEDTQAVEILVDKDNNCIGLIIFNSNTNEYEAIYCAALILATGGVGQIYKYTTNPSVTTGDGVALAKIAGAKLADMEFVQFHPTSLAIEGDKHRFLISEALRGEGAKLLNTKGVYFAKDYDQRGELAPRDIVTRANFEQMEKTNSPYVLLDAREVKNMKTRFPNIYKECLNNGIDPMVDFIPVSPAAHYMMGGVKVDSTCKTSINGLYAIGETACTGLHGANRLASNSLLECVVCAYSVAEFLANLRLKAPKTIDEMVKKTVERYKRDFDFKEIEYESLIQKLKETMWENTGIIRSEESLLRAKEDILNIEKEFRVGLICQNLVEYELRNMIIVSKAIIEAALLREESLGAHYRSDNVLEKEKVQNGKFFST